MIAAAPRPPAGYSVERSRRHRELDSPFTLLHRRAAGDGPPRGRSPPPPRRDRGRDRRHHRSRGDHGRLRQRRRKVAAAAVVSIRARKNEGQISRDAAGLGASPSAAGLLRGPIGGSDVAVRISRENHRKRDASGFGSGSFSWSSSSACSSGACCTGTRDRCVFVSVREIKGAAAGDADIPRRVAATPRVPRGWSEGTTSGRGRVCSRGEVHR